MKKILVAVEDYPDNEGGIGLMYVHTRNKAYVENNIDVTVLNFRAKTRYTYEGIPVITLDNYVQNDNRYDILVCHAANIRHHYKFLKKYGERFEKFIFFFHGHEVLKCNKTYSKPYSFVRRLKFKMFLQDLYDDFKLSIWRRYYTKVAYKTKFVFVSRWMLDQFLKWTKIPFDVIKDRYEITYNGIDKVFEETVYDYKCEKQFDFLTVRGNLDGSKYSIDIVNKLAFDNPGMKFLVVGKGHFFEHYKKAPNIEWMNKTMGHSEIVGYMQKSRCSLMPTRTDAQGLMMCEMASTGMPLITSDLPVCHEVFDNFDNVAFIDNGLEHVSLSDLLNNLERELPYNNNDKFYRKRTNGFEILLINKD